METLDAMKSELKAKVIEYVAEAAEIDEADVDFDANLVEDLGIDSLGIVGIFIDIAYDFQVSEPSRDEDWSTYDTPRKIFEFALAQTQSIGTTGELT